MSIDVVCGVDIGSTNTKVIALDRDGTVRFRAAAPTERLSGGVIDADAHHARMEKLLSGIADEGCAIAAVSFAGVGEDGVLVDDGMHPLCPVQPWFHPDRVRIFDVLAPALKDDPRLPVRTDAVRTIVGWFWATRQPNVDQAVGWVALTDWSSARWTGRRFMSDTLAARTAAWIPEDRSWLTDRVELTLGSRALLPEVVPTGQVLGPLESSVLSRAHAVRPDAVVVAGGHDHPLCGWALQQVVPGAVVDSMGTAEIVVTQTPRGDVRSTRLLDTAPGVLEADWTSVLAVQELDRNVRWAGRDPDVAAALASLIAGDLPPTHDMFGTSFLVGEQGGNQPRYEATAPADPVAKASAVLGAMAREGQRRIAAVAATMDLEPTLYATGGWARSPGWMDIKRRITGRPFELVQEPEVTATAAALLAAHGIGWNISAERALAGPPRQPAN